MKCTKYDTCAQLLHRFNILHIFCDCDSKTEQSNTFYELILTDRQLNLKAAKSVTFDHLILKLMFLFFKNTVKKLKFRYTFYQFHKSKQTISIKTPAFILKLTVYNYWRDANNYQQEKNTPVL